MTLTELMNKLEPLSRKRFELEHRGRSGLFFGTMDDSGVSENIDVTQIEKEEQSVYKEFEDLVRRGEVCERDLHTGILDVTHHGEEFYRIAFQIKPDIFSESTVEELSEILVDYFHYEEAEAYRVLLRDISRDIGDEETIDTTYEYPLWSFGFILDLNPSLINEKSFSNLLEALDNHLKVKDQFIFEEYRPPDPLGHFASLLGNPERYTSLLLKSKLNSQQVTEIIERGAIDSKVVLEAEKYLQGDTYESSSLLLKTVCEIKPEYILLGWRDCIEKAYEILPFAKDVPKENIETLEQNTERYGFSSSVSIPLAIGNRVLSDEDVQDLKKISEGCINGCKPEVGYYFTLALLEKRLTVPSIEKFNSAVCNYFSIEELSDVDSLFTKYMPKISNLDYKSLERLATVVESSKTQSSNCFSVHEQDRFKKLMERAEDITNEGSTIMNQRLLWLKTFETTKGDVNPDTYVELLLASDEMSFYSLWGKMQEERLYEFHIKDTALRSKINSFRDKYLDTETEPIGYTEEAQMLRKIKSLFDYRSKKNIDVIYNIAEAWSLEPFAVSQKTIDGRYRSLAKQYHPDKNTEGEDRFKVISDSKELLTGFVEYRDKKLRDKFGTLLPVKYEK